MIEGLAPYPAMKESGAECLGDVPAHWKVRRLRNVAEMRVSNVDKLTKDDERAVRLCNYMDVYKNDQIRAEISFMRATATTDEIERFRLRVGDVLITKDSEAWNDIGVAALVSESAPDLISGYHLALLRPREQNLLGDYLFRALQSKRVAYQFHVEAKGVTRFGLTHSGIKSVWLPLPSLSEQAAIVRYLDHADQRIRRYIRAKEKLIALLEEQKQAIVHEAVTGRIDVRTGQPYSAYKPSGVEWLGDVPAEWQVHRFGRMISLVAGFPFRSDSFTQSESDIRLLRGINVAPGRLRWDEVVRWSATDSDAYSEYKIEVGDIILGMDRPIVGSGIRVAIATEEDVPSLLLQRVARIRTDRKKLLPEFVLCVLNGRNFFHYLSPMFTGISVPHLSPDQVRGFRIALPSTTQQEAIVEFLTSQLCGIQCAVERAERRIVLLREYRTRLIADVVTGKLDVREAVAFLPEDDPCAANEELEKTFDAGGKPAFDDETTPTKATG